MPKKLTNEEVDERLIEKKIKRLSNYTSNHQRVNWQCEVCNFIWTTAFLKIMNGTTKCPHCNATRLNNNIVDERLKNRNILRLNDCFNIRTKIKWECKTCNYIWQARPSDVLNGTGCPQCAGNIKITNEIIDGHIKYKKIKRLSDYIGAHHKVTWQCEICDNVWETVSSQILNRNHGCPKCGHKSRTFTNEYVDYLLQNRNIKRLGNYIKDDVKINFQCLKENCGNIWMAKPTNILSGKGCPLCKMKNEKIIYQVFSKLDLSFENHWSIKYIDKSETKKYTVDFYFPTLNIILEYDGEQHQRPVCFGGISIGEAKEKFARQQIRDQYVNQFCLDRNIELIRIDGKRYQGERLEKYILNDFIPNKILKENNNAKAEY